MTLLSCVVPTQSHDPSTPSRPLGELNPGGVAEAALARSVNRSGPSSIWDQIISSCALPVLMKVSLWSRAVLLPIEGLLLPIEGVRSRGVDDPLDDASVSLLSIRG